MPGEGILSIGATVDKTGVDAGLSSIQEGCQATLQKVAVTVEETSARTVAMLRRIPEEVKASAAAVSEGQLAQARATVENAKAQATLRTALRLTKDANVDAAESIAILAAAQENVTRVAQRFAASQEEVAAATSHVVPATAAASGAIRVLEGNMPIRAVERFAVTTLGLGPILQTAFPVFGAVALGEMLVRTTADAIKFGQEAQALAQELGVGWLDGAVLQLEGFDKKLKEIDRQILESQGHIDKYLAEQKNMAFERIGTIEGPAAENTARMMALTQERQGIESMLPFLQEKLALLQKIDAAYTRAATTTTYGRPVSDADTARAKDFGITLNSGTMGKQIEQVTVQIKESIAQIEMMKGKISELAAKAASEGGPKREADVTRKRAEEQRQVMEQALRADEFELNQKRMLYRLSVDDEVKFWQEKLAAATKGSQLYAAILERLGPLKQRQDKEKPTSGGRAEVQSPVLSEGIDGSEEAKERQAAIKQEGEAYRTQAEEKMRIAGEAYADLQKSTEEAVRLGTMSEQQRVAALRAGAEQERQIRQQQSSFLQMLDMNDQKRYEQDLRQQEESVRQWARQVQQINAEVAQRQEQQYQQMFQRLTGPLNQFVDHWLTNGRNMQRAFAQMVNQMAMNWINALVQMGEKWLEHQILVRVLHAATQVQNTAATAAAAAAQKTATSAANVASATSNTAVAATGAAASQASIPIVGPALAAAAASAMTALGSGYIAMAAFEQGGIVKGLSGGAVPILAHAGERVLSAQQTANFERLVNQNSSTSTSVTNHFHDNSNYSAIDGASVRGMVRSHGREWRREMVRQMRLANH